MRAESKANAAQAAENDPLVQAMRRAKTIREQSEAWARVNEAWRKRLHESLNNPNRDSVVLERTTFLNVSTHPLPVLRRLSGRADDFAVIWSTRELAWRWFGLVVMPFIFNPGGGIACPFAARKAWPSAAVR